MNQLMDRLRYIDLPTPSLSLSKTSHPEEIREDGIYPPTTPFSRSGRAIDNQ